jgi:hypothetical protein
MKITVSKEAKEWFEWRNRERRKHRYMTAAEYWAWTRGGDAISSSCESNPFPGGLTIDFNAPAVIGRTDPDRTDGACG